MEICCLINGEGYCKALECLLLYLDLTSLIQRQQAMPRHNGTPTHTIKWINKTTVREIHILISRWTFVHFPDFLEISVCSSISLSHVDRFVFLSALEITQQTASASLSSVNDCSRQREVGDKVRLG